MTGSRASSVGQSVFIGHSPSAGDCPEDPAQVVLLWLARSDPSEDNAEVATDLWDLAQTQLRPDFLPHLVPYLGHQHSDVRVAAARALSAGVQVSTLYNVSELLGIVAAISGPLWLSTGTRLGLLHACWSASRCVGAAVHRPCVAVLKLPPC